MPAVIVAALAAVLVLASDALAQSYPAKPIRLIVPYPAGGATDFFARLVFPKVGDALGQPVVVENRPGAGTAIGASEVARSAPDGYTLLLGDAGTYAFNPTLYKKLSYDPAKDFAPVSLTGRFALILAVNTAVLNVSSVDQFVQAAKQAPGKIDYGAPGPGSPIHLAMELFKQRAGITMTPIPYKGGADALSDLIGGRIGALFPDIATGLPQIRAGKIKALAVASERRVAALPGLPTVGESGYPGFEAWAWQGFVAPAGTPREVVMKLNGAFAKVMADPVIGQRLSESGFEPQTSSPEQFAAYLRSEIAKWAKVIHDSNISLD
ncbi:MAG TPA: tripartite tricarboxylate transporter substrate binding protein [Burkholderiales bacterium]|jgi:tripartite-type tricarboxylate transporter receptor subunit TctC|nr:tripartite tricarboxylate transporter substrate binding protein [Burkholderiales bacterium]